MKQTEHDILMLFKKSPGKELSTSEIIANIFPKECQSINDAISNLFNDREKIYAAKQKKAQLHRNVLYYLNSLVNDDILKISRQGNRGEKYFALALEGKDEIIINKSGKKIILSKPTVKSMPIDGYEHGIASRFESPTWIDKINSILLETHGFRDINEISTTVLRCLADVNDAIALNDFEHAIHENEIPDLILFLKDISRECSDSGKTLSLIIDATNLEKEKTQKITDFLQEFCAMKPSAISIIFDIRSKELSENIDFFEKATKIFIKSNTKMYIKNQDLYSAPYFLGKAGPYCFDEKEWLIYKKNIQKNSIGLACSQATIAVDVNRFFSKNNDISSFRNFIKNTIKSLFYANSMQRRNSEDYFKNIVKLSHPNVMDFFRLSRNYVRFWNYGWKEPNLNQNYVIDLIKSTKEEVDSFCLSEETIYKSCGMPTRFKVAFSCLFKESGLGFSKELFNRIEIKRLEELYSKEFKELFSVKEEIVQAFNGGDRARLFRIGKISPSDICREFNIILKTFKIPFFCYDFGEHHGADLKLTSFIR